VCAASSESSTISTRKGEGTSASSLDDKELGMNK
jgi:hypothetical protein